MSDPERRVLHVLPHPGGGGDTYVTVLDRMPGYGFGRIYLADSAAPAPLQVARRVAATLGGARSYDLLHVHGEIAGALFLPLLAARPSVVTLHGLHLARRLDGGRRRVAALNLQAVLRAADCVICVSNAEHEALRRVVSESAARRAVVIHNGVPVPPPERPARAEVRDELGIPAAEPVAVWVGSLDARRDPVAAVLAANDAGVRLLVVGDGSLRPEVEAVAGPLVHLLGHRRDVPRLLEAADFYVLVSRREGLSFGLLEAMAHGLPAVVTDLAENVEAIGESGIAVPWGDRAALTAALSRVAGDERERAELGERARRRVVERFGARQMTERTRALYDDVLAARARPSP